MITFYLEKGNGYALQEREYSMNVICCNQDTEKCLDEMKLINTGIFLATNVGSGDNKKYPSQIEKEHPVSNGLCFSKLARLRH